MSEVAQGRRKFLATLPAFAATLGLRALGGQTNPPYPTTTSATQIHGALRLEYWYGADNHRCETLGTGDEQALKIAAQHHAGSDNPLQWKLGSTEDMLCCAAHPSRLGEYVISYPE